MIGSELANEQSTSVYYANVVSLAKPVVELVCELASKAEGFQQSDYANVRFASERGA